MAESEDPESKTEEPSEKKLEEALEKGQVVNSKEVNNFIMLFFLTLVMIWIIPYTLNLSVASLEFFIQNSGNISLDQSMVGLVLKKICNKFLLYLSPLLVVVVTVSFLSSYIQHGEFVFAFEQLQPQLSRISLIEGFNRLFSTRSLMEFLKGLFKVSVVGIFLYLIINADVKELAQYQNLALAGILGQLQSMVNHILICVCIIVAFIAIGDYAYQRFKHYSSLRMTKQEQKEEYKQTEGNPEVKKKIKSLRREQAQKRIKQTVPKATVIITNPEHYAVALQYEQGKMQAPILIAKGLDLIAQRIKEIGEEHDIPIVENPPLARSIYKSVSINQEIPIEHYETVAKIISYVMALKMRRKNG